MKCWSVARESEKKLFAAISIIFQRHPTLMAFLFDAKTPKLRRAPDELLAESCNLSSGEDLLIRVGMDLWSGSGEATVYELLEILDEGSFENVLLGLAYLGAKTEGWEGPVFRQLRFPSDNLRRQLKLDTESDF